MLDLRRSQRLRATAEQNQRHGLQTAPRSKRKATNTSPDAPGDRPVLKKLRLTEANLSRHERLHQQAKDPKAMGKTRKTSSTTSRTTVTTTEKQFGAKLTENGVVYEAFDTEAPDDVDQIRAALLRERQLPLQAKRDWDKIREAKRQMAQGELSLESMIVESMLYHHDSPYNYLRYRNDQWTEVDNEITAGISDPKPDVTEAHTWSAYPPGTRDDLEELVPSLYGYAMPTFAMESKGPAGDHEQAVKQAAYDGAVMTHAALAIEDYMGNSLSLHLRKTKAITVTLSPVEINVYANHAILDQAGKHRFYHQYRLVKVHYLESEADYNMAYKVVSNAQEVALSLAKARVQGLWAHVESERVKHEQMKFKAAKLHEKARAKLKATMAPPPSVPKEIKSKKPKARVEPQTKGMSVLTPPSSKHDL